MKERICARGHQHVSAAHASTLEVTTESFLTKAGDCIIGVDADRPPSAFAESFIEACRTEQAQITATINVGDTETSITGTGDPRLTCANDTSAVLRTSDYVDDRTVMVNADLAARDIDRSIIDRLRRGAELVITLSVQS